jgi:hypothetical protein
MTEKILEAIKKTCKEEMAIFDEDVEVTDGTEQINEGRAEFAFQIIRLITRLEDAVPERRKDYGFDSPEYKKVLESNARRTEAAMEHNSEWHPDA